MSDLRFENGVWFYNSSSQLVLSPPRPAIESIVPNTTVLRYCGLSPGEDFFAFNRSRFGFEGISNRITLEGDGIDVCTRLILEEVPRTKFYEEMLRRELGLIRGLQLRLSGIFGLNYRLARGRQ